METVKNKQPGSGSAHSQSTNSQSTHSRKNYSVILMAVLSLFLGVVFVVMLELGRADKSQMVLFSEQTASVSGMKGAIFQEMRNLYQSKPEQVLGYLPMDAEAVNLRDILVSRHETTTQQYLFYMSAAQQPQHQVQPHPQTPFQNKLRPQTLNDMKFNDHKQPVVGVDWFNADAMCRTAGMRLPTKQEYSTLMTIEMNSRSIDEFDIPTKTVLVESEQRTHGTAEQAEPGMSIEMVEILIPNVVKGYLPANGGLDNIIGNAMEWVAEGVNEHAETGLFQTMGYSYREYAEEPKREQFIPWRRLSADPDLEQNDIGFRCVYDLNQGGIPSDVWLAQSPPSFENDQFVCWPSRTLHIKMSAEERAGLKQNLLPEELCRFRANTDITIAKTDMPEGFEDTFRLMNDKPKTYIAQLLGDEPQQEEFGGFYLDKQEVSYAAFEEFASQPDFIKQIYTHPAQPDKALDELSYSADAENKAVVNVNWWQAFAYCQWQNKRLPFSRELELAAAGNQQNVYSWGDVYSASAEDITPQKVKGLSRQVSEWTSTIITSSKLAVVKGGNRFFDQEIYGRAYTELAFERDTQSQAIGFRCAIDG